MEKFNNERKVRDKLLQTKRKEREAVKAGKKPFYPKKCTWNFQQCFRVSLFIKSNLMLLLLTIGLVYEYEQLRSAR
jgi:hypothetical protein